MKLQYEDKKSNLSQIDNYTFKHNNPKKVTTVGSDKDLDYQSFNGFLSKSKFCHKIEKLLIELSVVKRILLFPFTEFFVHIGV